jgi:hypothetical protein
MQSNFLKSTPAHEAGASPIRPSLGPAFGYEPKAPLLSPMPVLRKFQSARLTTTKVRGLNPNGLLRFYDSSG